ncbi:MAG: hypothetical protein DMG26_14110 [Acidobacteria bacterium]|nr:MAG: hypothetical protein DMG26_14110 [Acidobacteriota bacterium]
MLLNPGDWNCRRLHRFDLCVLSVLRGGEFQQLRLKTSEVLKKVQQVGSITITLRGRPVAKLTALDGKKPMRAADHPAVGMWADREDMKDVHAWLKKIRTPRYLR